MGRKQKAFLRGIQRACPDLLPTLDRISDTPIIDPETGNPYLLDELDKPIPEAKE